MTARAVLDWILEHAKGNESAFDTFERLALDAALRSTYGEQTAAAEILKVSKRTMNYKLQKYCARPIDVEREFFNIQRDGGGPRPTQSVFDFKEERCESNSAV